MGHSDGGLAQSYAIAGAWDLTLVGGASLALFAFHYHVVPEAGLSRLARAYFALAVLGIVLLVPGIALPIESMTELPAIAGSFVSLVAMGCFAVVTLRTRTA